MREVKFRGKRVDDGEWAYGTLILTTSVEEKAYIVDSACHTFNKVDNEGYAEFDWLNAYPVIYKTVGQYIGFKDKNGQEIYEGDIVKIIDYMSEEHISIVKYDDELLQFIFKTVDGYYSNMGVNEVIGNIYENKELLEG